jgi:putative aminopeptidase FrvX
MTAVTGFEDAAAETLLTMLPGAKLDAAGNVVWTAGSGEPVRVAACALDEPGHVVGGITPEGYLTLRRAGRPLGSIPPERFLEGQRVVVFGKRGPVPGVVGVRSTHLQRGRAGATWSPMALEDAYVDVGAGSAEEVVALGAVATSPVARAKAPLFYGADRFAAPQASSRAACAALLAAALEVGARSEPGGTITAAFTRRRFLGWDGARFAIAAAGRASGDRGEPGSRVEVVLLGDPAPGDSLGSGAVAVLPEASDLLPEAASVALWPLPARYAGSPIETVSMTDVASLSSRLARFLEGAAGTGSGDGGRARVATGAGPAEAAESGVQPDRRRSLVEGAGSGSRDARIEEARAIVSTLVEIPAVSGSEGPMRDAVTRLLPDWAEAHADGAGNLRLRIGSGAPLVVFVAHLDEIGYRVGSIRADGGLEIEPRGGFYASLFEGEPALVQTGAGPVPAVFAVRAYPGTDSAASAAPPQGPPYVDPGTGSRAATEALGIRGGDTVTIPKRLTGLAGTRVSGRSLDDRVGCSALILALRAIDRSRLSHSIEFVWSVEEEIGLNGAKAVARDLAPERPVRVHAVDTFVSSDAPLERRTFAYAPLGRGAVIRAVDDSAVAPPALVDSLSALAGQVGAPLQVGATAGGNDGSAFTRYGVPAVAIGWPLRYSHSPAEVMDLRDLLALADVVQAIAERW